MNSKIRPGGGPQTPAGHHLGSRLPQLVLRLRGPELDHIATLINADNPTQIAEVGRAYQNERNRYLQERTQLLRALEDAPTPQAQQEIVRNQIRSAPGGISKNHEKALLRWLDGEALLAQIDHQIASAGVYLEVCARLLGGLDLNPPAIRFLRSLLNDSRLPTRREGARSLSEWCVAQQISGKMDTLLAEDLLKEGMSSGQDPITARNCLLVISALGAPGDSAIGAILSMEASQPPHPLLRSQAVRMALLGGPTRRNLGWEGSRLDPSEQVRCALADSLSAEASPVSLDRLRSLAKRDPASSVRQRAQLHLANHQLPNSLEHAFNTSPELGAIVADCADLLCGEALTTSLPDSENPMDLAVSLIDSAQSGYGYAIAPAVNGHVRISRGDRKVLRFWRILHEARTPLPGKRFLGDHLSGRAQEGPIRVRTNRLSERSSTGVPNQPHHVNDRIKSASWLPMPEEVLEAADWGSILLVTPEGVTTLTAPRSTLGRLWSQLRLSTQMNRLTKSRSAALKATGPKEKRQYIHELEQLGYRTEFQPHAEQIAPLPGIEHYFGWMAPPALAGTNSPSDLAIVAGAIGAYSLMRLSSNRRTIKDAREAIPLCIGNWGTRGKSSVTRLQAALFEGLGYTVLCKTTGSEASLFFAGNGQPGQRLPTYRPLDKVSIFEHGRSMGHAQALGAQVFLWECMALRPEYVSQVQEQWTRDDLSTITNAHADHEDVQGPTGRDVAEVIAGFIPSDALAISTEQAMSPILSEAAETRGTHLLTLSEEEIRSLPTDLLESLPYKEHPANFALALQVAQELGCDLEEAGFLIATHAKGDLGALRTTPPMRLIGRSLSMSNGMSANQPEGLLNNWESCGFFEADPLGRPNRCFVSVVNNRQDRPQRSRAFARSLVRSLPAHRHILIGSNLEGFRGQIKEELHSHLAEWRLPDSPRALEQRLRTLRKQLCLTSPGPLLRSTALLLGLRGSQVASIAEEMDNRIAQTPSELLSYAKARAQLEPIQESLHQLAHQIEGAIFHNTRERRQVIKDAVDTWLECAAEALMFSAMAKVCAQSNQPDERLQMIKDGYTALFMRHILLLPGSPSPDDVMSFVVQSCPPGTEVHALAIQNIQGPGFGLARAIQSTCETLAIAEQLQTDSSTLAQQHLAQLRTPRTWTIPLCQEVLRAIYAMPARPQLTAERDLSVNHVHVQLDACEADRRKNSAFDGAVQSIGSQIDGFMTPFRAIVNRRKADQILKDLSKGWISRKRAAQELEALVNREQSYEKDSDSPLVG